MLNKLQNILKETPVILISSLENFRYLTRLDIEGYLIITENEKFLITDGRYFEEAESVSKNYTLVKVKKSCVEAVTEILLDFKKPFGFEEDNLSYKNFLYLQNDLIKKGMSLKAIPISYELNNLRMCKEDFEIELIKESQEISENALKKILPLIRPGVSEKEIACELNYQINKRCDGLAFDTIVLSGKRTSLPHGKPSFKKIENHDLVLIDFGSVSDGYKSDMTRTFSVGSIGQKEKKVYESVKKAKNRAIDFLSAKKRAFEVDEVARKVLKENDLEKYFKHSLGHGVGLLIHELPNISKTSESVLQKNSVVTIEPGVYIDNEFGIRIEDLLLVTDDGCRNLTEFSDDLIVV